jgi:hypothetical protein
MTYREFYKTIAENCPDNAKKPDRKPGVFFRIIDTKLFPAAILVKHQLWFYKKNYDNS